MRALEVLGDGWGEEITLEEEELTGEAGFLLLLLLLFFCFTGLVEEAQPSTAAV